MLPILEYADYRAIILDPRIHPADYRAIILDPRIPTGCAQPPRKGPYTTSELFWPRGCREDI